MEPTAKLLAQVQRDHVRLARQMTGQQRLLAGGELFDAVVERMAAGIAAERPGILPVEVLEIVRQRLSVVRRLEERREHQ